MFLCTIITYKTTDSKQLCNMLTCVCPLSCQSSSFLPRVYTVTVQIQLSLTYFKNQILPFTSSCILQIQLVFFIMLWRFLHMPLTPLYSKLLSLDLFKPDNGPFDHRVSSNVRHNIEVSAHHWSLFSQDYFLLKMRMELIFHCCVTFCSCTASLMWDKINK